jgi:hypothetical protein
MPLKVDPFGPFLKGVVDGANPSLDNTSTLRSARHVTLSGKGRLMAGPGSAVAMTLMDDQGSPAPCTSVVKVQDFSDGALAIGHSTVTSKVYLYRLDSEFTGYYDIGGAFHASATAVPVGVLWTASATPPVCTIAELLNVAFIARTDAATAAAQNFPMQRFDLASLTTSPRIWTAPVPRMSTPSALLIPRSPLDLGLRQGKRRCHGLSPRAAPLRRSGWRPAHGQRQWHVHCRPPCSLRS